MSLFHAIQDAEIYLGDNLELIKHVADATVSLTVTSPPYDCLRDYTGEKVWSFAKFQQLAEELFRVTAPGGVVVWNVNDQTINGSETGSSMRQALFFMDCGFSLADTMIYKKANPGGARGSNKTYIQCFEYMYVLSKGPLKTYNLLNDRPNVRPGTQTGGGKRRKNGEIGPTCSYDSAECGRRLNIWEYPTQTDKFSKQHPAPFPFELAEDHILSWSNPGDLVFDPFAGSGTTLAAAITHQRRALGFEVSETYANVAKRRLEVLENERVSLNLFGFSIADTR